MNSGVLVLNATYQPINIVRLERAICLVVQEKADVVEHVEGKTIRSANTEIPFPSVVRLRYFVKVPWGRRRPAVTNRNVLARDNHMCAYCGNAASTIDHVHPRSRGGKNDWMNVVSACSPCNSKKGDQLLDEIGWELLYQPTIPPDKTWLVIGLLEREQQAKYINAWATA